MSRLDRFLDAQESPFAGYAAALDEIRNGRKQSHWIWYVFPQLAGLGQSAAAHTYGLADADEAADYLRDPTLRARLLEIATAVAEQLRGGVRIATLMGSSIDARKLVSSMTLFEDVAQALGDADVARAAGEVLQHAQGEGLSRCEFTRAALGRSR